MLAGRPLGGGPFHTTATGQHLTLAEATGLVPVGTAAVQETNTDTIDPAILTAFGLGSAAGPVSREAAMRIPGIRRGRSLIAGTIGTLPLVQFRTDATTGVVTRVRSTLLEQLDPTTTPAYTLTWTVDDLLFRGVSWWRVTARTAPSEGSYPTAVERLNPSRVTVDLVGRRVWVDGKPAQDRDIIRIDGPDEGVLANGTVVLPLATALLNASLLNAVDDVPTAMFRPREGAPELTQEQVNKLLADWAEARRTRRTAYLNRALDFETPANNAADRQLTELSTLVASELARLLNLPASRIGAPQGSGMTYSNTEADRRDLVDTTLRLYLTPIAQRLSMPDVTPRGNAVTFDLTAYLRGTTSELVSAGTAAVAAGFATKAEVRTEWLGLPPNAELTG